MASTTVRIASGLTIQRVTAVFRDRRYRLATVAIHATNNREQALVCQATALLFFALRRASPERRPHSEVSRFRSSSDTPAQRRRAISAGVKTGLLPRLFMLQR